jgi:hypothetical protein
VPQVLIPYTEVLGLYNDELQLPEDVIICWPDDNFGYIRQLPNESEQQRSGGSGIYYHFQWLNGSTTAYPWLHTTPPALTWTEMMKAYEHGARELWIVNVGDIKPMEIGIEHFMRLAWDIESFRENDHHAFLVDWARRDFGAEHAEAIADIMMRHFELGFARRPEHMVMKVGGEENLKSDWFSLWNYGDEAQERIDAYEEIMTRVEEIYEALPDTHKDAFFQMVVYNVKGAALHNQKVLYAQKSEAYGKQKRASAATYAARAQEAEKAIFEMIHHYNREQVTVGDKWDRMASLPGPWGVQWRQFEMPPTSSYSGEGLPHLALTCEGGTGNACPPSAFTNRTAISSISTIPVTAASTGKPGHLMTGSSSAVPQVSSMTRNESGSPSTGIRRRKIRISSAIFPSGGGVPMTIAGKNGRN